MFLFSFNPKPYTMEHAKIIGANIKSLRELNGVKQELLAKKLGVSKGRMSQIEHGDCHELSGV